MGVCLLTLGVGKGVPWPRWVPPTKVGTPPKKGRYPPGKVGTPLPAKVGTPSQSR